MTTLSTRQEDLLKIIIQEYIESTEAVGSQKIVEKYSLRVSPATVRAEMVNLIKMGYLEMLHTSSGRVPTTIGFRHYVNALEEKEIPILQEVAIKQKLWPVRFEFEKMLRHAALSLSDSTKKLAIATTYDGHMFHAGSVHVLEHPEFWDINVAKAALHLLDNHDLLHNVFTKVPSEKEVKIIIGEELGLDNLKPCSLIFSNYSAGKRTGVVAVLGPSRMDYENVVPAVRHVKNLVEELGAGW